MERLAGDDDGDGAALLDAGTRAEREREHAGGERARKRVPLDGSVLHFEEARGGGDVGAGSIAQAARRIAGRRRRRRTPGSILKNRETSTRMPGCVPNLVRPALLALAVALPAAAHGDRLGTLVRWYLDERVPSRRWDFLDAIERVAGGDPEVVARAIREGAHLDRPRTPRLRAEAPPPELDGRRVELFPAAACAGHFASLDLPDGYDPGRPWPLLLDLQTTVPAPAGLLVARVKSAPAFFPQGAQAAESYLLSLLAHLYEVANVDPARVYLQGEGKTATLAWYVALHNPDRFAGVITAHGAWEDPFELAPNGRTFSLLAVEPPRALFEALLAANPAHARLARPANSQELLPAFASWLERTVRAPAPPKISLALARPDPIRCFWLRASPAVRSEQTLQLADWTHRAMRRLATIEATVGAANLVTVQARNVAAFDLFVDPKLLDPKKPVRVSINGAVPEARWPQPSVADLLEDFRERRDPALLYACKLTFAVPGR